MSSCTKVTKSNYICMDTTTTDSNYKIGSGIINKEPLSLDTVKNVISLTEKSSNYYFTMDEKAHCSEKWQDWFCIQNYHNGNGVNKYPITKTMSVGVCYSSCPEGYIKSASSKSNKCIIYYDEDDLIYNPLAIIAILGTFLRRKDDNTIAFATNPIQNYDTINDTIGMRGSYLNDLYRLNIQAGTSITKGDIAYINGADDAVIPAEATSKQQQLLLKIIKHFANKNNIAITAIKGDINDAIKKLYEVYITRLKGDEEEKAKLLNRIKNYAFNMEKLKKLYGKEKNEKPRFQNIILYAFNIMRFVFYDETGTMYESSKIDNNIRRLLEYNLPTKRDKDDTDFLIKIFKYACYNCFNINYDIFKKYVSVNNIIPATTVICIINDKNTYPEKTRSDFVKFEMKDGETTFLEAQIETPYTYVYPYYNNISFYDHQLLHEYSENTQYITKILIILGVILGLIPAVCLLYYLFRIISYATGFDMIKKIINFINYCFIFYNSGTFALIKLFAFVYYYLIYNWGKTSYTIVSVFFKLINISILIVLTVIAFILILELLNMDYVSLLKKMNYLNNTDRGDVAIEDGKMLNLILYLVSLYLIGVYMYCIYIIRVSINEDEYNILGNVDSQSETAVRYIDVLLLRKYISNITSSFNFMFTTNEIDWAVGIVGKPPVATSADAPAVADATGDIGATFGDGTGVDAVVGAMPVTPVVATGALVSGALGTGAMPGTPVVATSDVSALLSDAFSTGAPSARGTGAVRALASGATFSDGTGVGTGNGTDAVRALFSGALGTEGRRAATNDGLSGFLSRGGPSNPLVREALSTYTNQKPSLSNNTGTYTGKDGWVYSNPL